MYIELICSLKEKFKLKKKKSLHGHLKGKTKN